MHGLPFIVLRDLQGQMLCAKIVSYVPIAGASLERCTEIFSYAPRPSALCPSNEHNRVTTEDLQKRDKRGKFGVRIAIGYLSQPSHDSSCSILISPIYRSSTCSSVVSYSARTSRSLVRRYFCSVLASASNARKLISLSKVTSKKAYGWVMVQYQANTNPYIMIE